MPYIQSNEHELYFTLRRSLRAKRLQIIFKQAVFEIVAPKRITNIEIIRFAWQQKNWMLKVLEKIPTESLKSDWPIEFLSGEKIPYRASKIELQVKYDTIFATQLQETTLWIKVPTQRTLCISLAKTIQQQIYAWYQRQAEEVIKATIDHFCPFLGRWPRSFHLKQQKSRWGSCGIQARIYLNWLLILAPQGVLEYVVVHELCHLFHRNHGKRFWAKVATCLPNYQEQERWLKLHGQSLKPMPILF